MEIVDSGDEKLFGLMEELLAHSNYTPTRLKTVQLTKLIFNGFAEPPPDRDDFCVRLKGQDLVVRMTVVTYTGTMWWVTLTKHGNDRWHYRLWEDPNSPKHYYLRYSRQG